MKVLQILPSLDVGGVERGVIDLARAMKRRGEETVVISSGGELVAELQRMGVTHYTLPVHQKSLFSLFVVSKIVEIIRKERITLIHARSRVPAWLAWLAARKTKVPFITTCHGYYSKHLMSCVMGWGKLVIAISRVVGRHMIDDFGVSPEKIRLIHRGIDLSQFAFDAAHYDQKPAKFRVLNIGRFSPIKGQVEFVKAIHLLRSKLPELEVSLVGSEAKGKTKYTREIEKTIHQLGLESCVKLLGTRRDIPALIQQSDLLVLSTLVPEAFGRVIVEAGAVGTTVLSTRVGGVLDIIDDGENGLLVPAGDCEAMAERMFEILTDRARSKRLAVNLRRKVEEQFTLDAMVDKTIAAYHEIERQRKILIIKLGAMGDLILGTPSFRMIRKRFPEAWLSLLVDKKLSSVISTCPYLNEVIPVNRKKLSNIVYLFKVAKRLRREGYDISVDLQNTKWTHILAALSGIPGRFGFRRGNFGFLMNRHDNSFEVVDTPVKHQFRILSKLGIKNLDERLELWPDHGSEERIAKLLAQRGVNGSSKLIGFAIGASPKWPSKCWPLENFKELGKQLLDLYDCHIVLIGSEAESAQAREWGREDEYRVLNFIGQTSMLDLVSLVKRLDVLVTGDTAPLHIAAAMDTKIVTLFGPTDPKRHVPPGDHTIVLARHLVCQPCYDGVCKEKDLMGCLRRISVEEVLKAVQKQLP